MLYYIGGLVVAFLGGAAAMFFALRNNPTWIGIEVKVEAMMKENRRQRDIKKAEALKKLAEMKDLAKDKIEELIKEL